MKLEEQVCSLELSKKLKELGVPQESLYVWVDKFPVFNDKEKIVSIREYKDRLATSLLSEEARGLVKTYSAFTVAELGEVLPQIIKIKRISYQLFCSVALDKQWFVVYANEEDYHDNAPIKFMMCHNEADARAKMLIYLLENNLTKLRKE